MPNSGMPIQFNNGQVLDGDTNQNAKVNLPLVPAQAGNALMIIDNNPQGTKNLGYPLVSRDRKLQVGLDTPLFDYSFSATVQNTNLWRFNSATQIMAQSGNALQVNSSAITTASTGTTLNTWRQFRLDGAASVVFDFYGTLTSAIQANQNFFFGAYHPAALAQNLPTDGVFFRVTSAGLEGGYVFNNGSVFTVLLAGPASEIMLSFNTVRQYRIIADQTRLSFWVEDVNGDLVRLGSIVTPVAQGSAFSATQLPLCIQSTNTGVVGATPAQMRFTQSTVLLRDNVNAFDSRDLAQLKGNTGAKNTEGSAIGNTALLINAVATQPAAAAALANVTAAVQFVGLGGYFRITPTLALNTDGILCSFQNPAAAPPSLFPRPLRITGVRIQGVVQGTALVGGPGVVRVGLAHNHTAVSLATVDTASFVTGTSKQAIRRLIGVESWPITAPIGTLGPLTSYECNIVINPGEFFQVFLKNEGTAFTAGEIGYQVDVQSEWVDA